MPSRSGPLYVFEIAQALAQLPGRLEFDHEESRRIGQDMLERFERDEFEDEEVVVRFGDPPQMGSITEARADAARNGRPRLEIDPNLWYAAVALTYPAAKRYVKTSGLAGAKRVLDVLFSPPAPARDRRRAPQQHSLRAAYQERVADFQRQGHNPPVQNTKSGELGDREWAVRNAISRKLITALRREFLQNPTRGRPAKNPARNSPGK